MRTAKIKLILIGGFCMLIAVFGGKDMIRKGGWPEVPAEIVSVNVECQMESTKNSIVYKTVSSASIPCEMVEPFKALHSDKTWTVTRKFTGTVRVGTDAGIVETTMDMETSHGREPQVGDKITVIQNPARQTQVERSGMTGARLMIVFGAAVVGALCLFFAFRRRRSPPAGAMAQSSFAGDALDTSERARKADAMIAAALARQGGTSNQAVSGRMAAAASAREARYAGPRASFGRKS
jgi:hypothetical protein